MVLAPTAGSPGQGQRDLRQPRASRQGGELPGGAVLGARTGRRAVPSPSRSPTSPRFSLPLTRARASPISPRRSWRACSRPRSTSRAPGASSRARSRFSPVLRPLDERILLLELFHGPTCAFKDFGAQFLAACMEDFLRGEKRRIQILVATSGDTGSAVAHAFHGRADIDVVILYPSGTGERAAGEAAHHPGRERPRPGGPGQLRRLPAPGQGGLPGPAARRRARPHLRELDQHRQASSAEPVLHLRRHATGRSCSGQGPRDLRSQRQLRQPHGRRLRLGMGTARARLHRGHERERRGARLSQHGFFPAPRLDTDPVQRDGRGKPQQLRAARAPVRRGLEGHGQDDPRRLGERPAHAGDHAGGARADRALRGPAHRGGVRGSGGGARVPSSCSPRPMPRSSWTR